MTTRRLGEALQRIILALSGPRAEVRLSDVFFDAADRDSLGFTVDHGYDCDDLAAVLLPILLEHFDKESDDAGGEIEQPIEDPKEHV